VIKARLSVIPSEKLSLRYRIIKLFTTLLLPSKRLSREQIIATRPIWEKWALYMRQAPEVKLTFVENPFNGLWVEPKHGNIQATILFFHGGGYCLGSLLTHQAFLTHMCQITQTRIFALNYPLAPEHPFPAGLDEAKAAYQWIQQDIIPSRQSLFLSGDSAGGGLVLALLLALKAQNLPMPNGAICFSPWADLSHQGESYWFNDNQDFVLYRPNLPVAARMYIAKEDEQNPLVSPIYGQFDGLPPLFIQTALEEILLSDSLTIFSKVKSVQGAIILELWQDRFHAWAYSAPFLKEGRQALEHVRDFIANKL
jgi:acetyl esterase/lipase